MDNNTNTNTQANEKKHHLTLVEMVCVAGGLALIAGLVIGGIKLACHGDAAEAAAEVTE